MGFWLRTGRRTIGTIALAAAVLGLVGTAIVAVPASAADAAALDITTAVDKTAVAPSQTFTYTISPSCSSSDCLNAAVTDTLPSEFDALTLNPTVVVTGDPATYAWGGTNNRTLTVQFTRALDGGGVGLASGDGPSIQVSLTVPGSLSPDWPSNGVAVANTAQVTADNADAQTASATTTITVPYTTATTATAIWAPSNTQYDVGEASNLTLTTRNTSNAAASSLSLALPTDPTAGNLFDRVDLTGLGAVTFPAGADRIQVDAYVAGAWVTGAASATAALPTGVDASTVTGLRFTFTSSSGTAITASGTAGSVVVQLAQRSATRAASTSLVTGTVVTAAVTGSVVLGSHGSTSTSTSATYTVAGLTSVVDGSTAFLSPHVPAGTTVQLTVNGKNTSNGPLSTFVVTEDSGVFGPHVTFAGFGSGAVWPAGATSATLSWSVDSGTAPASVVLAPTDALPTPTLRGGQQITGFSIAYTGSITAGTTATVPVLLAIDSTAVDQSAGTLTLTNTAHVDGSNAAGVAPTATRTGSTLVYYPQVSIGLAKTITPSAAVPAGGRSLVRLLATTASDSAYVHPTTVTIVDALTADPASSQYWGAFDAVAIAPTQVPAGSTLTVATTTDGAIWTDVSTTDATSAAKVYSGSLTDTANIIGVRFTFVDTDGFGQGNGLQGNISFVARSTIRGTSDPTASDGTPGSYTNAATATAVGDVVLQDGSSVSATAGQTAPAGVKTIPSGSGGLLVGKAWQAVSGSTAVNSQSGQSRTARVTWGTEIGGYSTAVVQEPATPTATGAGTVFQNFNLTGIAAITPTTDPSIAYDEVTKVELFDGTTWTPVGTCTSMAPCAGQMPAFPLSTTQQNSTVGVRITFAEYSAGRLGDALAPPVGSGVASGENLRPVDFVFQLRNKVRDASVLADPTSPWITAQKIYNGTDPGVIVNDARLTLGGAVTGTASDSINVIDNPPAVSLSKTVSNGTLVIPSASDNIAAGNYPATTFTLTATNASAANAWYMRVTDQMPCAASSISDCAHPTVGGVSGSTVNPYAGKTWDPTTNPFNDVAITSISVSNSTLTTAGIDPAQTKVTLWYANGTTSAPLALTSSTLTTATSLVNVVGVSVLYVSTSVSNGGTINGTPVPLTIITRLRQQSLDPSTPIAAGSVTNSAFSQTWDGVLNDANAYTSRSASFSLTSATLAVTPTKTISPSTLLEKDRANNVTVTLKANQGSPSTASPNSVVVADTTTAFWNAFQLRSIGTVTFPTGANRVEVDVQVNGSSTWTLGTAAAAAALPTGVTLSQVTGIRYTFTNTNASPSLFSIAVPAGNWAATAPFTVNLRSALRDTGGAVPFPTTIVDQLDASAASPSQGTKTASTTAPIVLGTGTFTVDISKTPAVATSPAGETVNWTLAMTNTGTGYLNDPVVTDSLPIDAGLSAGGPLLFDPTSELTYADSSGGILPVTGQTVVYNPTTRKISISWPAGARLAPSETYTIVIPIQVTPGLPASYGPAVNKMTFSSGRTLAGCANSSGNGQGFTLSGSACTTQNSVSTLAASAISSVKGVKGDVDNSGNSTSGAVNVNNAGTPCVADSQGFYRNPCAAYTVVGGTDLWKLQVTNGGNVAATGATIVDVLPKPGDVYLRSGSSRGSTYKPVFANGVNLSTDALSAGTTMIWQVTTAANPCPSYATDALCSAATWQNISAISNPASITAIRATFDFSGVSGGTLPPAANLSLTFKTVNSPSLTTSDKLAPVTVPVGNARAWNSFGVYATFGSGFADRDVEPVRAGVQLSTGPIQVSKTITGSGAAFAPTSYTATVSCTVAGAPVTLPAGGVVTLAASNATPYAARIDSIPVGASCSIVEGASGASSTSYSSPSITVAQAASSTDPVPSGQTETITNSYGTTSLVVSKHVSTTATVGGFGPFAFTLACTANNGTTTMNVPLATGDASFSLAAEASHTITGLPVTARCNLTETDSDHANRIGVAVDSGSSTTVTQGQAATIVLGTHAEYDAVVTNSYDGGKLAVSKTTALSGLGDLSYYGSGPFTVAVTCTYDGQTLLDTSISISAGATNTFAPVFPAGTSCAVSETDAGGASTPAAPTSVMIPGPTGPQTVGLVTAGLTNTFATGTLRIDKAFAGSGAAEYGAGPFTAQATCTWQKGTQTLTIPLTAMGVVTLDAGHGYSASVTGLIAGANCTVAETATGGATSTSITQPAAVTAGGTAVATITNRYDTDRLVISKVVAGEGAGTYGGGSFTAGVSCTYPSNGSAVPIDLGADASVSISPGHDATISNLLIGASCTVTETATGLSVSHSTDPAGGVVTIVRSGSGVDPAHVTITNQFLLGSLHIVKTASASIVQGGTDFGYTLAVSNTGDVDAAGVTVVDVLDPTLAATGITAPGWTNCAIAGADSDGFGGTLSCVLDTPLAVAAQAPGIVLDVRVADAIAQDDLTNRADVTSTTPIVTGDHDSVTTPVKWLNVVATPSCLKDAPYLAYTVDAHNVDVSGKTMTVKWLTAAGTVVHTDTVPITANGPVTGTLLWPGASVDQNGDGIGWPGWRAAAVGETPDWQNLVLDPTLPEYGLRSGAKVEISINPTTTVAVTYPPSTPSCGDTPGDRTAHLWFTKDASVSQVTVGRLVDYVMTIGNDGLGAAGQVTMIDPVPASLKVTNISPAPATDASSPGWASCTMSDQTASGYGGTMTCVLDRALGAQQTAPAVTLTTMLNPRASFGPITNTAHVTGIDLSTLSLPTLADPEDSATIWTMGGLAFTGVDPQPILLIALLLLLLGGLIAVAAAIRRRRA